MASTIRCAIWQTLQLGPEFKGVIRCQEFQRLRHLKQLGFVFSLYPGAIHSRYEHSLGTAHLCKIFLDALERNSRTQITPFHKKCVIIAGLLHDVGHGPFSHAWERISNGKHEEMSMRLVDRILNNSVDDFFEPAERNQGVLIVQSLINGDASALQDDVKYLAEIVSNKFCELDVDKWDYIMRDLFYLRHVDGIAPVTPESFEFFLRAEIRTDAKGISHIAYRLEDLAQVKSFFATRRELRRRVYLHPRVEESEVTFCEILKKASKCGFVFNGRTISEATEDIDDFGLLNDSIMNHLEIFVKNNRKEYPELFEEFAVFKAYINQFTDYLEIRQEAEALKIKRPLFFSGEQLQRIEIPY